MQNESNMSPTKRRHGFLIEQAKAAETALESAKRNKARAESDLHQFEGEMFAYANRALEAERTRLAKEFKSLGLDAREPKIEFLCLSARNRHKSSNLIHYSLRVLEQKMHLNLEAARPMFNKHRDAVAKLEIAEAKGRESETADAVTVVEEVVEETLKSGDNTNLDSAVASEGGSTVDDVEQQPLGETSEHNHADDADPLITENNFDIENEVVEEEEDAQSDDDR
jgi:hypothetical protein